MSRKRIAYGLKVVAQAAVLLAIAALVTLVLLTIVSLVTFGIWESAAEVFGYIMAGFGVIAVVCTLISGFLWPWP